MALPVHALAVHRTVGCVPTRGAFFHLGVRELAAAGITFDLFRLFLPSFFTFLFSLATYRQMSLTALLTTGLATVELTVTLPALDAETANISMFIDLSVHVATVGIFAGFT